MTNEFHLRRRQWLRQLSALGLATSGWVAGADARPADDPIRIGQSAPLTGPAQQWGLEYRRGIRLAFDRANAQGGIGGRSIELISYDDQYEPALAKANTDDLITVEKVSALIGYVGSECVHRSLPAAQAAGMPFIAPLTGDESLRHDPPRGIFNIRAGDDAETLVLAKALATIDFRRVAVAVQSDADGDMARQSLTRSLKAVGLPPPVLVVKLGRNSTGNVELRQQDVVAAVQRLLAARPDAVVCLSAFATTGTLVRRLKENGFAGGCYATSLSSASALASLLGPHAGGMSITQVMPSPNDSSRPVVAAYQKQLHASGDSATEYVSLEGWIAGSLVVEALLRSGASIRRERFMAAMESLSGLDLGGYPVAWDPAQRQFRSRVTLTVLDASGRPRT